MHVVSVEQLTCTLDDPTTVTPRTVSKISKRAFHACGECGIAHMHIGGPHDRNTDLAVLRNVWIGPRIYFSGLCC